ncbi:MAG: hypothetical protein LBD13_04120, partial [Spirochaetaceae bacterium]|nr:hypothetical protein [Spirochaetaceae bacterium]
NRFESDLNRFESDLNRFESDLNRFESDLNRFESDLNRFESDLNRFESNPDFFVCGLMVYSSIAYGLLRDGAVCSGLPVEPAPPAPSAGFLGGFFYRRFMVRGS